MSSLRSSINMQSGENMHATRRVLPVHVVDNESHCATGGRFASKTTLGEIVPALVIGQVVQVMEAKVEGGGALGFLPTDVPSGRSRDIVVQMFPFACWA